MKVAVILLVLGWSTSASALLLLDEGVSDWSTPDFSEGGQAEDAAAPEAERPEGEAAVATFDARPVPVDPRARFELQLGLWLVEQASHLRSSNPSVGLGFATRLSDRLRLDGGYRFALGGQGTQAVNVFNTFHALRARLHYAVPAGGSWFTLGGGPVGYVVTSVTSINGAQTGSTLVLTGGAELALGVETQVAERLVRFEVAVASRALRFDGWVAMGVGF